MMVLNSPFYPFLLIIGATSDRRQGFALLVFVLGHSIISHKEFRFIWPVLPLVFLLIAEGFEAVCCFLRPRPRAAFVGLFAFSVCIFFAKTLTVRLTAKTMPEYHASLVAGPGSPGYW
jgi:Alg9-like mannosyltransferase family